MVLLRRNYAVAAVVKDRTTVQPIRLRQSAHARTSKRAVSGVGWLQFLFMMGLDHSAVGKGTVETNERTLQLSVRLE